MKNEKYKKFWENLVNEVYNLIVSLNEENISVKTRISYVKKYKNIDILKNLEEKDVDEIIKNLSSLPFSIAEKTETIPEKIDKLKEKIEDIKDKVESIKEESNNN